MHSLCLWLRHQCGLLAPQRQKLLKFAMSTTTFAFCLSTLLCFHTTRAQLVVPFQTAAATSAFSSGAFPAADALSAGSGYWCRWADTTLVNQFGGVLTLVCCFSSGNHAYGERVAWTGSATAEPNVAGVAIDWSVVNKPTHHLLHNHSSLPALVGHTDLGSSGS